MTQQASLRSACRTTAFAVMALIIVSIGTGRATAAVLYATSNVGNQIDKVDTVANTVTTYLNTPSAVDSIMFDSAQRVIYTQDTAGDVRRYDPSISTRHGDRQRLEHSCRHRAGTGRQHNVGQRIREREY